MPVLTREIATSIESDAWVAQHEHASRLGIEIALATPYSYASPDDKECRSRMRQAAVYASNSIFMDIADITYGGLEIPAALGDDQIEDWLVGRAASGVIEMQLFFEGHIDG